MALHHSDMAGGHVTPDGVVYHQQIDPEHDDLQRMDDDIHDPTYATEHEVNLDICLIG